jgi:hypothetical protein
VSIPREGSGSIGSVRYVQHAILGGRCPLSLGVHAVFLGPCDTDMTRELSIPKASPAAAARGIFDGFERGEEDIFPDPLAQSLAGGWHAGAAKALERQNASHLRGTAASPPSI